MLPFAHYFLPRESNNHKAKLLHHSNLVFFILLLLIFQLVISSVRIIQPSVLGYASQIKPERVVELVNQERSSRGLPALKFNNFLNESALRKAGDMFAFNYWAHNSPSGREPWAFFKESGYKYLYAGENLARDFPSAEEAVNAWMASPSHRDNILNPKFKEIGLAVVDGTLEGKDTTLIVQHLGASVGTPKAASIKLEENIPTSIPQQISERSQAIKNIDMTNIPVLSKAQGTSKYTFSPFSLTKNLSLIILAVLLLTVVLDGLVIWRKQILRISGRNLAHFFLLVGAVVIIFLGKQGAVL